MDDDEYQYYSFEVDSYVTWKIIVSTRNKIPDRIERKKKELLIDHRKIVN